MTSQESVGGKLLARLLSKRKSTDSFAAQLEAGQREILEMAAKGIALPTILEQIVRFIESLEDGLLCSILLLDGSRVRHGAAPSLPPEYNHAIDGAAIGPDEGSCGAAASRRARVIVADIASHPNWVNYKHLALTHGLRSCWSSPIFSVDGNVLGTFAIYKRQPGYPTSEELSWVDKATHLAAVAIQKQVAEDALRMSEDRYRITTEAASDVILGVDADGNILFANHATKHFFGYEPKEVMGKKLALLMPEEFQNASINDLQCYTKTNQPGVAWRYIETSGVRKDGSKFPIEVSFGEHSDGRRRLFSGVIRDLTVRKEAEEKLRIAKERAEDADRAKNAFITNISHELRTPLTSILGYADLLATRNLNADEKQTCISVIQRNGISLKKIIDDILDLAKIEAGKMSYAYRNINIIALVQEVVTMLELQASHKNIKLTLQVSQDCPDNICTDPDRAKQILVNIVGNAVKFTMAGCVDIFMRQGQRGDVHNTIEIEVKDTGPGMSEEQVSALFKRFSQVDDSLTRAFGGCGLGLVLAKNFAQGLGGDVTLLKSAPMLGSTFLIRIATGLPASKATAQERDTEQQATNMKPLKDKQILVIDDSPDIRELYSFALLEAGAKILLAENGIDGVRMALKDQPDAVLMDVQMPLLSGCDAAKQLREHGFTKPILALSAHALPEERTKALASGCNTYASKPIPRSKLIDLIKQQIEFNFLAADR